MNIVACYLCGYNGMNLNQGFSYLNEVVARGLLNLGN